MVEPQNQYDTSWNVRADSGTPDKKKKRYSWVRYLFLVILLLIAIPSFFIIYVEIAGRITLHRIQKEISENVPTDNIKYDIQFNLSNDRLVLLTNEDRAMLAERYKDPSWRQVDRKLAFDLEIDSPEALLYDFNCEVYETIGNDVYRAVDSVESYFPIPPVTLEEYGAGPDLKSPRVPKGNNRVVVNLLVGYVDSSSPSVPKVSNAYVRGGSLAVSCRMIGVGINTPHGGTSYTTPTQWVKTTKDGNFVIEQAPPYQNSEGKTLYEPQKVLITKNYQLADFLSP